MLWREHLCRFRAWSAAGLLTATALGAPAWAEPAEPLPSADASASESVSILDAVKAGDLSVEVRGAGQDRVKMTLKNASARRLKVVIPPGLVASSAAAQGRGFQSMGLGDVDNRAGSFGAFRVPVSGDSTGFRSVAVSAESGDHGVAVPAGQSIDLNLVSVCLNFGVRTPNPRDKFDLVDVNDYTNDPRARKALRSLATYGTSQGVAQAAMWRVCNDVPFDVMSAQAMKVMNPREIALAARFVEALDASGSSDLVDPAYLTENRVFVKVSGDGALVQDAARLAREIDGLRVMGLPVRVLSADETPNVAAPGILLSVGLTAGQTGETRGRVVLSQTDANGHWAISGKTSFREASAASALNGEGLAGLVDCSLASAFVSVKVVKKTSSLTTVRVENHLPFTLASVALKAGSSSASPTVNFAGVGVAPGRSMVLPVQAASATLDRVDLNGL